MHEDWTVLSVRGSSEPWVVAKQAHFVADLAILEASTTWKVTLDIDSLDY